MYEQSILQVTNQPLFDDSISRLEFHGHQTYGSNKFDYNDELRICVQTQDIYTLPCESYIYVEGSVQGDDEKKVDFTANAIAFMLDEIRYEIGGVEVDRVNNVGITTTIKNYLSLNDNESKLLENAGWGVNFKKTDSNLFNVCIPLKMLMGFFEDYKKIILNVKQELIFVRSNTDLNSLKKSGVVTAEYANAVKVNFSKIIWQVPYVQVSDSNKLQLLKVLNSEKMLDMCFRTWELYEYPELPITSRHTWSVKTSYNLERPRYIIIAFQTDTNRSIEKNSSEFHHCNVTNIKAFLNSEIYPYTNLNLNFASKQVAILYDMYCKFQKSYYNRPSQPLLDITTFINNAPLFVIDCSKQSEALKSTTVDLRLEFEASQNFPAKTRAYCLMIHDRLVKYNPLTNIVTKVV